IEAIRLFVAYASFKDFVVYQMDVKSDFVYGNIEEEVYVCQPPGFEDPDFPDRDYKVEKALYGLHQALRAWYETLSTYLLDNGFQRGNIDKTLFIKRDKNEFMGELAFFLGLQMKYKEDDIFISQDKYVSEILNKFGFSDVNIASTPMETQKPLLKDEDGVEVDVHMIFRYLKGQPKLGLWYPKDSPFDLVAYTNNNYAGASLNRKSTTGGCQFLGCRLISWQCKKQTVVANSTTEAEYVAASSCYGQVLWIQNQLLDYGHKLTTAGLVLILLRVLYINTTITSIKGFYHSHNHFQSFKYSLITNPNSTSSSFFETITMTTPMFVDVHNMVAFLAKLTESEWFEQIIDFLNANPIKYALTVNPTVYTLCIEQLWTTAKVKNINGEAQIHAKVDGKKLIISEASIRRDLRFGDKGGVDCFLNKVIFEQLTLVGSIDPHHTPTIIQPSTSQPSRKHKSRKTKRMDTKLPQISVPIENIADETVNEEIDDNLKRATTTATSLDAERDTGNIIKTKCKATPNEPSFSVTSSGGGPRRQDTMGDTIAQTRSKNVSKFSNDPLLAGFNTPRSGEDNISSSSDYKFEKRVRRLEKKRRSRTHGLKRLYKVGLSARIESSAAEASLGEEDASKQRRKINDIDVNQNIYLVNVHRDEDIFGVNYQDDTSMFDAGKDLQGEEVIVKEVNDASIATSVSADATTVISIDELTLAQALMDIKNKGKGVMVEPEMLLKKKAQISLDKELAFKLQAKDKEEERLAREKAQEIKGVNTAWDDV
nr:hypothetical protein [Tanacetum cinerariifolium]